MIRDSHIVDFPFLFFSLFCSFLYLWKWLFKFWYASKKAYPGRQTTNQSQLTICPSFFLFFFLFLFSLFFPFFSSSFTFFLSNRRKKKDHFFFFLSCSCSGPKPGRSGEQWQTCRRQPGPSAFCLSFKRILVLFFNSFFSYCLKVKEWLPFHLTPPTVWQQCFFLHFFFSWVLVSGFLDLLSFSRGNRFSVLLVVCGIAGFSYFDSVCVSFVILLLYFSWGFVTPHC